MGRGRVYNVKKQDIVYKSIYTHDILWYNRLVTQRESQALTDVNAQVQGLPAACAPNANISLVSERKNGNEGYQTRRRHSRF